ncbi:MULTISPECIES: hypothetical protein [Halostella]|uniref:hypothetical protein n=1 Tax=Halostella TaxID=1843185 RepID=UPI0010802C2C|nr:MULTISPECIES: hypothetical protein [Halostella]
MATGETAFPECCGFCPHRQKFSAGCDHDLRQSLVSELATESEQTCPVFNDWRTQEMKRLADNLPSSIE